MTTEEFLKIKHDIQLEISRIFKIEYPNHEFDPLKMLLYPCEVGIHKNVSSIIAYENKNYPFKTDEDRITTYKIIRKLKKAKNDPREFPYDLYPFPVIFTIDYPLSDYIPKFHIILESQLLYQIIAKQGPVSLEWNKSIYTEYSKYNSKKYIECIDAYIEYFGDRGIAIGSKEFNDIAFVYTDNKSDSGRLVKKKITNIITDYRPDAKWEDVSFLIPSKNKRVKFNSEIGIKYKGVSPYTFYDFKELRLIKKNGQPMRHWTLLNTIILDEKNRSKIIKYGAKKTKTTTQICRLNKYLIELIGINSNALHPFDKSTDSWKPKFRFTFENDEGIKKQNAKIKYEIKQRSKKMGFDK